MSSSLAVLQFLALASGDWPKQKPANKKKTRAVTMSAGVCLGCHVIVDKDQIDFEDGDQIVICRACGRTVMNGVVILGRFNWKAGE